MGASMQTTDAEKIMREIKSLKKEMRMIEKNLTEIKYAVVREENAFPDELENYGEFMERTKTKEGFSRLK